MLAGARLAILFIGVYIVLSVLMHMRNGQWLTAAGPFKVADSVRKVQAGLQEREEVAEAALKENERLKAVVSDLDLQLRTNQRLLLEARGKLATKDE